MGFFSNVGTFDFMYEFHSDLTLGMAQKRQKRTKFVPHRFLKQLRKTTIEVTKRIKKTLATTGKEEVEMVPILNDSKMFSKVCYGISIHLQTVENFFAVSFLVANGRLGIDESGEGPLALRMTRPSEDFTNANMVNQGILSLNPVRMYQLLKEAKLDKDLDPAWSKQQFFQFLFVLYMTNNRVSQKVHN